MNLKEKRGCVLMMKRRRSESEEGVARLCSQRENGGYKQL